MIDSFRFVASYEETNKVDYRVWTYMVVTYAGWGGAEWKGVKGMGGSNRASPQPRLSVLPLETS